MLYKSRWHIELCFNMDKTAFARQAIFRHLAEHRRKPDLNCCRHLRAGRNYEKRLNLDLSLHAILQVLSGAPSG
jgi:hypothetical protein